MRSRAVVARVVIVVAVIGMAIVNAVAGIPAEYANAQFGSPETLLAGTTYPPLPELNEAATNDLVRFIPGYASIGVIILAVSFVLRGGEASDVTAIRRAALFLAVGVLADLIETVLFRSTVDQLIDGTAAEDLGAQVFFTRVAFVTKFAGVLAAVGTLGFMLVRRSTPSAHTI